MQKYIGGLATLNTMLHMLQDEIGIGSKTTCLDAMGARVHFKQDNIKQFGDITT